MSKEPQNDAALMRALQNGDETALPPLIERWEKPLFSFAYRYVQNRQTARDIVEETIVRLFTKKEKYNPSYPLSTWLFSIAANLCKNHARWVKRHPEHAWDSPVGPDPEGQTWEDKVPTEDPTPAEETDGNERRSLVRASIEKLPHDLKVTLLLHYFEGMSYQEISVVSNCSIRGVESRLYRARKQLKANCEGILHY